MTYELNEKSFLADVAKHEMTILRDDGVNRHVRFSCNGSSNMRFDLITWSGYLCYCGDMGTYVFSRIDDMFQFFRTDRRYFNFNKSGLSINKSYWGEKLQAESTFGEGYKKYSQDKFKKIINEIVENHIFDSELSEDDANELRDEINSDVIDNSEFEYQARESANEFKHNGFELTDFWEYDLTDYTHHYVWCCYALAWGIEKYDETKLEKAD